MSGETDKNTDNQENMSSIFGGKLVFWNRVCKEPELVTLLCSFCVSLENINTNSNESMAFCGSCRSRLNRSGHPLVKCPTCPNPVYIGKFNRAKYCKKCVSASAKLSEII
jgi:hypothetical protein